MQLNASVPVNVINLSDEEIAKIIEAYPFLIKVTIPAGTYDGIDQDVNTVGTPQGAQTTTKLSQQDGYNIVKAMFDDGKSIWQAAYPSGAENDYVAMTCLLYTSGSRRRELYLNMGLWQTGDTWMTAKSRSPLTSFSSRMVELASVIKISMAGHWSLNLGSTLGSTMELRCGVMPR